MLNDKKIEEIKEQLGNILIKYEGLEWKDIVNVIDREIDVLACLDEYRIIESVEETSAYVNRLSEEREAGYIHGYDDCEEEYLKESNELSNFKIWPADKKRKYLCDLFGLNYYDINGLKNNLKFVFEQK